MAGIGKSKLSSFPTGAHGICSEPVIKLLPKNSSSCHCTAWASAGGSEWLFVQPEPGRISPDNDDPVGIM